MSLEARMVALEGLVRRLLTRVGESTDAVTSVFGRTGAVAAASNDYTWAQINKATSSIADITTKSHTALSDIGTNTHAAIDTHIADTANPHSTSDANLVTTDVTTNNASITKHGFLKKLDNVATNFLNGTGAWSAPASSDTDKTIFILASTGAGLAAGQTKYLPINGYTHTAASEDLAHSKVAVAGTMKNLNVYVSSNTNSAATTFTFRDDAADTALTVSIAASTSGWFADTSNAPSVAANSILAYEAVVGAGSGTMNLVSASMEYDIV